MPPRRTPAYRGTKDAELRARFESLDERLAGLRGELVSLFELVLENRTRLSDLEETTPKAKPTARRRSRRRSRRRRRSSS